MDKIQYDPEKARKELGENLLIQIHFLESLINEAIDQELRYAPNETVNTDDLHRVQRSAFSFEKTVKEVLPQ